MSPNYLNDVLKLWESTGMPKKDAVVKTLETVEACLPMLREIGTQMFNGGALSGIEASMVAISHSNALLDEQWTEVQKMLDHLKTNFPEELVGRNWATAEGDFRDVMTTLIGLMKGETE